MKTLSHTEQSLVNGGFVDCALGLYAGRAGWDFSKVMAAEFVLGAAWAVAFLPFNNAFAVGAGLGAMAFGAIGYKIGSDHPFASEPSVQQDEIATSS